MKKMFMNYLAVQAIIWWGNWIMRLIIHRQFKWFVVWSPTIALALSGLLQSHWHGWRLWLCLLLWLRWFL